jgi:hypothetical protein
MPTIATDNFTTEAFIGPEVTAITYAATPDTALFDGSNDGYDCFDVAALTGNITIPAMTGPVKGRMYHFFFLQDGTGGRTVTWNAQFVFPTSAWSHTSNTLNKRSSATFVYDGYKMVALGGNTWR